MRRPHVIVTVVVVGALLALAGAAWGFDRTKRDTIAEGVSVAGVDVGGLERAAAQRKLERDLLAPLQEPIVVRRYPTSAACDADPELAGGTPLVEDTHWTYEAAGNVLRFTAAGAPAESACVLVKYTLACNPP